MAMCGGLLGAPGRARAQGDPDRWHALLRAVLNEIPDPIFLKDRDGRMLMANRAALNVIGKRAEDVLGKTSSEYLENPQLESELLKSDYRVLETGAAECTEQVLPGPAGPRVFLTTRFPFRDDEGNLIGVIGVSRDITERRAAETAAENSERLALILEATSGGFWDWNIQTGGAKFSPQCCAMLGYAPDEFATNYKSWKDMVHPNDLKRLKQHQADHFAGRAEFSVEFRMKEKS